MQSGTVIITRSTNTLARAVGVFVTLTASHANHNSTHSSMRRDLCPDLGNVRFTSLYPKLYLPNKHPLLCYGLVCCPDHVNCWRRANVLTCVIIIYEAMHAVAVVVYSPPADCPQLRTQWPQPFEIDSDFPWSSVARAQRPMESSV